MSQTQMIQAGIQIEAARELGKLARPLIQKIIRVVHSTHSTGHSPAPTQFQQRDMPRQRFRIVFTAIVRNFMG